MHPTADSLDASAEKVGYSLCALTSQALEKNWWVKLGKTKR